MLHRRTLLIGTAGLTAGSLLSGCSRLLGSGSANSDEALKVTLLEGAVPSEVIQTFRKQVSTPTNFQLRAQMQSVFQQLQRWQQSPTTRQSGWRRVLPMQAPEQRSEQQPEQRPAAHNLVSLGDYWLQSAIEQDLIEPLPLSAEALEPLPIQWQQFVSRDASGRIPIASEPTADKPEPSLWAAPYKVQSLVIVYRQRTDHPAFETWADLLDPALKGKIALPDHPNVVLGLLQKMQTGSFNSRFDSQANNSQTDSNASTTQLTSKLTNKLTEQLSTQLAAPFAELNQQVRTYDSRTALKALVNEDLQAIVTWSGDVVTALQRYRSLRAIVPEEGSLLSADMWVRPKGASLNEAARAWIDFCWQTGPATQLSVSGAGISPTFLTEQALPETIAGGYLSRVAMQNSEPLLPLPEAMQAAYFALWQQLRSQAA